MTQVTLTATFESVEEMHDWVLKTAEGLRPSNSIEELPLGVQAILNAGVVTSDSIETTPNPEPVPEPVKEKPKRKRRTKAEMAAARAAEAAKKDVGAEPALGVLAAADPQQSMELAKSFERASNDNVGDEQGGNGTDPQIVVDETTIRHAYAEAFRGVLESRLEEGISLVKGAGLKRFSEGTLEQQVGILKALEVEIPAP